MKKTVLLFTLALILLTTYAAYAQTKQSPLLSQPEYSPEQALALLHEGNQRFIKSSSVYPNQTMHQRKLTSIQGEKPFATIITGSDSRIIPAIIFDRGIGDLYVIRNLGNVAGTDSLASIEYSILNLKTPLLIVLGNTESSIIQAAINGEKLKGHLAQLEGKLIPAINMTKKIYPGAKGKELVRKVAETNIRQVMRDILGQCPTVLDKFRAGEIKVLGAVYDIDSGVVKWLGP